MSEATAAGFTRLFSDQRLTRRAVEGDQRAFAAIFQRYHQNLYRFCLAIVGNPDDAQDALQNTMAKVLRALPGEEREIELKPWLYRIAHNESIDLLRRRRETSELDVEQVAPGYGLAEDVATRERLRRLLDDLRELPERQREVLVMRELSGFEFDEIGAALGTSGAVARQTVYEARQSLRQMDEGREMGCEVVTQALSDGDGRVIRRRDVRAHLRSCLACQRFQEEIESRQHDLAALSPLPAVVAAGMLQGLLGGSSGGAGGSLAATLGGGAAKSIGASAAVKGAATVAVMATIGVTAADQSGVIHLGLPGDQSSKVSAPVPGSTKAPGTEASDAAGQTTGSPGHASRPGSGSVHSAATGAAGGNAKGGAAPAPSRSHGDGQSNANGHGKEGSSVAPAGEHPNGEKAHPDAAGEGQETADDHAPPQRESESGSKAKGESPASKAQPAPSPEPPETPDEPPAQAPDGTPAQSPAGGPPASPGPPSQAQPNGEHGPPTGSPGKGKGDEKSP